jgi:hypothetical protein
MFSTTGRSSSAISAWLWPSRVRWPASVMMIWLPNLADSLMPLLTVAVTPDAFC